MAPSARLYDLMIALSTTVEEERRAKLMTDIQAQITAGGGVLERNDDWHARPLAYEIRHQGEGEYHLLQFTATDPSVLDTVSHNLRIDDAVLRFRIIKNVPGTPPPPETAPPIVAGAGATPASDSDRS